MKMKCSGNSSHTQISEGESTGFYGSFSMNHFFGDQRYWHNNLVWIKRPGLTQWEDYADIHIPQNWFIV